MAKVVAVAAADPERDLVRALTVQHAAAVVVGTVIGSGIFLVPAEMMQALGSSGTVYLAWIAAALLFFGMCAALVECIRGRRVVAAQP